MLKINHLSKTFGELTALNQVSFTVPRGQITGLIGQNGAGKSTTFHSILNLLSYEGEISWNNFKISKNTLDEIGYLPEERSLLPKLTVENQILYLARLKNKTKREIAPQINSWLKKFQVNGRKSDKIKDLSKGNQQKIQLICTLITNPKLIILDEPFSGLDPINTRLLNQAILEKKKTGAAVIFSSHDMVNVENICDNLVMLNQGRVVLNGRLQDVREQFGKTEIYLTSSGWSKEKLQSLPQIKQVVSQGPNRYLLYLYRPEDGKAVFNQITGGKYIPEFSQQPPTLGEIFRMKAGKSHV